MVAVVLWDSLQPVHQLRIGIPSAEYEIQQGDTMQFAVDLLDTFGGLDVDATVLNGDVAVVMSSFSPPVRDASG